jgi:hypothetical protein
MIDFQISEMENERRLNARDREAERTQFERRITELSQRYKFKKFRNGYGTFLELIYCLENVSRSLNRQIKTFITKDESCHLTFF